MVNQTALILGPPTPSRRSASEVAVLTLEQFAARYICPMLEAARREFEERYCVPLDLLKPAPETSILRAPDARPGPVENSYTP
jgi:hypothetical protein